MRPPTFSADDFLVAARLIAAELGPAAVTVDRVTQRVGATKGAFYYRFTSRDELLSELWLGTVLRFQEGFVAAIEAGDGLAAALHTPAWVRGNPDEARLLVLHRRHDCRANGPGTLCARCRFKGIAFSGA